eukprot:CAMPEP_0194295652 /NCGR_PEP_ID=MMETSP0169-20130528/54024_1 /TAXON_ID=218684 /ORGANISM="Corethron pennatum, Strain L29A3" /LENGTH=249 /DNA_ID=CAMNT_0039044875 /DNA_START=81 /DNA_END=830 /DNA_ORIENTATION=-
MFHFTPFLALLLSDSNHVSSAFMSAPASCRLEARVRNPLSRASSPATILNIQRRERGDRRAPLGQRDKSKRQERVQQLVRTELASIIHKGHQIRTNDQIGDGLRRRISIVNCDVSPDLRQCRVTVSTVSGSPGAAAASRADDTIDRREAYAWLVQNTVPIRHALAQRMSHMRGVPNLTFAQADIGAAVDVMYLIDRVSNGAKRASIGEYGGDDGEIPEGMFMDLDFDDDGDDFDWDDNQGDEDFGPVEE